MRDCNFLHGQLQPEYCLWLVLLKIDAEAVVVRACPTPPQDGRWSCNDYVAANHKHSVCNRLGRPFRDIALYQTGVFCNKPFREKKNKALPGGDMFNIV